MEEIKRENGLLFPRHYPKLCDKFFEDQHTGFRKAIGTRTQIVFCVLYVKRDGHRFQGFPTVDQKF
jgi:hypothetical protein